MFESWTGPDETKTQAVREWIVSMKAKDLRVTHSALQLKALEFSRDPSFKASNGWCQNFIKRYNASQRNQTHLSQKVIMKISQN